MCERHNRQGIIFVCKHIREAILEKELIEVHQVRTGIAVSLCQICHDSINEENQLPLDKLLELPEEEFNRKEQKREELWSRSDIKPTCIECFREARTE